MIHRLLAILPLLLGAAPAAAFDATEPVAIGFSADSRYFAFEQYELRGDSGTAYVEINIIDTATGKTVEGSPFKVESGEEEPDIIATRAAAAAKAAPAFGRLGITRPIMLLAATPVYEVSAERQKVTFDRWLASNLGAVPDSLGVDEVRYGLNVETSNLAEAPQGCDPEFGPFLKLRLMLWPKRSAGGTLVFRDEEAPVSGGCPVGYDIDKVVAPLGDDDHPNLLVVLVGVYEPGWEGTDRRVIAIPTE
jgi:predicted secreted protein